MINLQKEKKKNLLSADVLPALSRVCPCTTVIHELTKCGAERIRRNACGIPPRVRLRGIEEIPVEEHGMLRGFLSLSLDRLIDACMCLALH